MRWFLRLLLVACFGKALVGTAAGFWGLLGSEGLLETRLPVFLAYLLVFGVSAAFLSRSAQCDSPAWLVGLLFAFVTSPYTDAALRVVAPRLGQLAWLGETLRHVQLEAFLAFVAWRLARDFPKRPLLGWAALLQRAGQWGSLALGAVLFTSNLTMLLAPALESGALSLLSRRASPTAYWPVLFAALVAAVGFLVWKAIGSPRSERRRVALMVVFGALGVLPQLLATILHYTVPAEREWLHANGREQITFLVVDAFLLSVPFTWGYYIWVDRVFDLKHYLRRGTQYLLARFSIVTATAIPAALLVAYVVRNSEQSVQAILLGRPARVTVPLVVAGIIALGSRRRLLAGVDRLFFRDAYDAQQVLSDLVFQIRRASSPRELAQCLAAGIAQALHLEDIDIFLRDDDAEKLESSRARRAALPASSALALALSKEARPVPIALEGEGSYLSGLPTCDQHWLADAGVALLIPVLDERGLLIGLLTLGEKPSELPYSQNELQLLTTVAAAAAGRLEQLRERVHAERKLTRLSTLASESAEQPFAELTSQGVDTATECAACDSVFDGDRTCPACGAALTFIGLPFVINGKYELRRRLGRGGMGVVYLASDLGLDRYVAIKTLPRISLSLTARLRSEARAMAAVVHPNLAVIHGSETCQGVPLLVLEYLEEGTLADRLAERQHLDAAEVLRLGIEICSVLSTLHQKGILHRDIKPSNIGLAASGALKLMDFGLAKLLSEPLARAASATRSAPEPGTPATHSFVGTPLYMSPEALRNRRPGYSFDLWSTSVVLFEALTGNVPFVRSAGSPPDRDFAPERLPGGTPSRVTSMFSQMFHRDRLRRPRTASQLRRLLMNGLGGESVNPGVS